ncbi:MAG: hypothetical protein ABJZ55_07275 [Fuerstiella sp.]
MKAKRNKMPKLNPVLIRRLKRAFGDPLMSTEEVLRRCIMATVDHEGMETPLHKAIVQAFWERRAASN